MHSLGNDYVYVNCFEQTVKDPVPLSRTISDRHRGVGADGLILICPSDKADVKMRIFNADGSEAQMCGNGIRCVAKYAYERSLGGSRKVFSVPGGNSFPISMRVETGRGVLALGLSVGKENQVQQVCVNMGRPILAPDRIPVAIEGDSVIEAAIDVLNQRLLMTCVSMGNPHAVFFTEDLSAIELEKIGPVIEHHELFPQRVNAHFVKVNSPQDFTMITWERGSGATLACGTGACACCVAAVLTNRCGRIVTANLPGGTLQLNWSQQDDCVYMTGPATEVFTGTWPD